MMGKFGEVDYIVPTILHKINIKIKNTPRKWQQSALGALVSGVSFLPLFLVDKLGGSVGIVLCMTSTLVFALLYHRANLAANADEFPVQITGHNVAIVRPDKSLYQVTCIDPKNDNIRTNFHIEANGKDVFDLVDVTDSISWVTEDFFVGAKGINIHVYDRITFDFDQMYDAKLIADKNFDPFTEYDSLLFHISKIERPLDSNFASQPMFAKYKTIYEKL